MVFDEFVSTCIDTKPGFTSQWIFITILQNQIILNTTGRNLELIIIEFIPKCRSEIDLSIIVY